MAAQNQAAREAADALWQKNAAAAEAAVAAATVAAASAATAAAAAAAAASAAAVRAIRAPDFVAIQDLKAGAMSLGQGGVGRLSMSRRQSSIVVCRNGSDSGHSDEEGEVRSSGSSHGSHLLAQPACSTPPVRVSLRQVQMFTEEGDEDVEGLAPEFTAYIAQMTSMQNSLLSHQEFMKEHPMRVPWWKKATRPFAEAAEAARLKLAQRKPGPGGGRSAPCSPPVAAVGSPVLWRKALECGSPTSIGAASSVGKQAQPGTASGGPRPDAGSEPGFSRVSGGSSMRDQHSSTQHAAPAKIALEAAPSLDPRWQLMHAQRRDRGFNEEVYEMPLSIQVSSVVGCTA